MRDVDGDARNRAGVDQVTYGPLPTDGFSALDRTAAVVRALAADFAGQSASMPSLAVTAVERRMAGQRGNPLAIAASEAVKASPGR